MKMGRKMKEDKREKYNRQTYKQTDYMEGVVGRGPMPDTAPTADGDLMGADVLLMLGNDKAGQTLEALNPDLASGGSTQVTSPPVAGDTTTTTTAG